MMALNNIDGLEPVALTDLKSGDQVALKRKVQLELFNPSFKILNTIVGDHYYHHGIFIEPHYIIHQEWLFRDAHLTRACKEDINKFMRTISVDGTIYKVVCDQRCSLPVDDVIKRAEEMVSEGDIDEFNIVTNNCETFATFLKTGKRGRSSQVQKVCRMVKAAAPEVYAVLSVLVNVQDFERDSHAHEEELDLD